MPDTIPPNAAPKAGDVAQETTTQSPIAASTITTSPDTGPKSVGAMPRPAAILGYGGLIPFAIGAIGAWFLPLEYAAFMASAQIYYAAIILSFLGAVHWGWALGRDFHTPTMGWEPYGWGITPAVISWLIVVLSVFPAPGRPGGTLIDLDQTVTLLIAALLLSLLIDLKRTREGRFPHWYRRLRLHLTTGAVLCLGVSLARIITVG